MANSQTSLSSRLSKSSQLLLTNATRDEVQSSSNATFIAPNNATSVSPSNELVTAAPSQNSNNNTLSGLPRLTTNVSLIPSTTKSRSGGTSSLLTRNATAVTQLPQSTAHSHAANEVETAPSSNNLTSIANASIRSKSLGDRPTKVDPSITRHLNATWGTGS
ncbi:MAG: hypothetical protein M1812_000869 [Candelaria pacifica]|nr:MAG: hypothetical protein M1812_000869 [Candelaria pacifica]